VSVCAGGIIGLGEGEKDRVGLIHQVRRSDEYCVECRVLSRLQARWPPIVERCALQRSQARWLSAAAAGDAAGAPGERAHQRPGGRRRDAPRGQSTIGTRPMLM
jgi:hypothetical protein